MLHPEEPLQSPRFNRLKAGHRSELLTDLTQLFLVVVIERGPERLPIPCVL